MDREVFRARALTGSRRGSGRSHLGLLVAAFLTLSGCAAPGLVPAHGPREPGTPGAGQFRVSNLAEAPVASAPALAPQVAVASGSVIDSELPEQGSVD